MIKSLAIFVLAKTVPAQVNFEYADSEAYFQQLADVLDPCSVPNAKKRNAPDAPWKKMLTSQILGFLHYKL